MKLATFSSRRQHMSHGRLLTREEVRQHKSFLPIVVEARDVFGLFRLLDLNYKQWRAYLDDLLNARYVEQVPIGDELNRLIINYLTLAYTIREHFEVSFQHRFRKDQKKIDEYNAFIGRMCEQCWAFAFLLDFRNYVQHRGLPVSSADRKASGNAVRVIVNVNAKQLLRESRNWKLSGLTEAKGNIDLIETLKEFHIQMFQSFAKFVQKTFMPELEPAAEFYEKLTVEAKATAKDNEARMLFLKKFSVKEMEGGGKHIQFVAIEVPNSLFLEIGIAPPNRA